MRDDCDLDDLVDVIEGSRIYIPAIYVINKIDQVTQHFLLQFNTREPATLYCSSPLIPSPSVLVTKDPIAPGHVNAKSYDCMPDGEHKVGARV